MPYKKPQKTPAQIFMEENESYRDLIGKLKAHFNGSVPDSSANSNSDETHILYFDAFMKFVFEIEPDIFVAPFDWASAFLQEDLELITRHLCKAILAQPRNLLQFEELSKLKHAIQTAALWMMQKYERNLNPWSFSVSSSRENFPPATKVEEEIINRVISQWETEQSNICKHDGVDNAVVGEDTFLFDETLEELFNSLDSICKDIYEKVFNGFMKIVKNQSNYMNSAQVACALTRSTIPTNTDIFVDAVQISNSRFTLAYGCDSLRKMTLKLCTQIVRRDIIPQMPQKQFNDVTDMCPVKRLTIYRAVKFLHSVKHNHISARTTDFNAEIEEHNVYPTREELIEIDAGIMDTILCEAKRAPGITFELEEQRVVSSTQLIPEDLKFLPPSEPSLFLQDTDFETISQQPPVNFVGSWVQQQPNPIPIEYQDLITYKILPGVGMEFPSTSSVTGSRQVNESGYSTLSSATLAASLEPKEEFVKIEGHSYPKSVYNEARRKFELEGSVKAGKYLFKKLFTHNEKKSCNISGRKGAPKFSEEKINSIMDAIKYWEASAPEEQREPWTKDKRKILETKVIVDTSNQYRKKHKNTDSDDD